MKKVKLNLALLAILLGTGAAFASNVKTRATVTWGRLSNGTYVVADSNDRCNGITNTCKAVYPEGQDPNMDASGPISTTLGSFVQVP